MGFNPGTRRSEWTRINDVSRYEGGDVWRIGNKRWSVEVTADHRWWSDTEVVRSPETLTRCPECGWGGRTDALAVREGRTTATPRAVSTHRGRMHGVKADEVLSYRGEFIRTHEFRSGHRLLLAAPADTGGAHELSKRDARVIAWLQGDGHIRTAYGQVLADLICEDCEGRQFNSVMSYRVHRAKAHGERGLGHAGATAAVGRDGTIYQSKPQMIDKLRALLVDIPHTEAVRGARSSRQGPQRVFRLRRAYVTRLFDRSPEAITDPQAFVRSLSASQRAAWLDSMIDAEGHRMPGRQEGYSEFVRIAQIDGPLQDAIKLAVYLEGYRPTYSANSAARNGFQPAGTIGLAGPHVAPSMFSEPDRLPAQPVWCVATEVGTWTAMLRGQIFLTGGAMVP